MVDLTFEGEFLPCCFLFHIQGYFWLDVPIPCVPLVGVLWKITQDVVVVLWYAFLVSNVCGVAAP
jgi:hypothetical protein